MSDEAVCHRRWIDGPQLGLWATGEKSAQFLVYPLVNRFSSPARLSISLSAIQCSCSPYRSETFSDFRSQWKLNHL